MKKKLSILGLGLISMLIVGCGGGGTSGTITGNTSSSTTTTSEAAPSSSLSSSVDNGWTPNDKAYMPGEYNGEAVTINFYSSMGGNKKAIIDLFLEDFNALYPNITVEHNNSLGDYDGILETVTTELSTGGGPDIAFCYGDHVALYNVAKKVVSLDNLIEHPTYGLSQDQKDDYIQAYYNEGNQFGDGLMYMLPFAKSTEILYYNATFFEEHNLTVPTTWDEMETVCAQIKEIDPYCTPLGYDSSSNWFITMCEQMESPYTSATGDHFLFDNAENKAFAKRVKGWYDKGYITTEALNGGYTSSLFTAVGETERKAYMCIGSSAGASYQTPAKLDDNSYPFEAAVAPIPQVDAENSPAVISQGPSLCLLNQGDPTKVVASWLLMKFLTTDAALQATYALDSGYVPVVKSAAELPAYKAVLDKAAEGGSANLVAMAAKQCLAQEQWYYTSPAFNGSSEARKQVGTLLDACIAIGNQVSDVDAEIDRLFAQAVTACKQSIGIFD